jgi:DNA-binding MarR family transcriptional regulator
MAHSIIPSRARRRECLRHLETGSNLDKALISRETNALSRKGLVKIVPVRGSARKRSEIRLSKEGAELLARSFEEILRRHDNLTAGLDPQSIKTLLRVIRHLETRIGHMSDKTAQPISTNAPIKRIKKHQIPQ